MSCRLILSLEISGTVHHEVLYALCFGVYVWWKIGWPTSVELGKKRATFPNARLMRNGLQLHESFFFFFLFLSEEKWKSHTTLSSKCNERWIYLERALTVKSVAGDRAIALAPRRSNSTPIEARCLVKVSVVGRGLSWSCSLWPRNTQRRQSWVNVSRGCGGGGGGEARGLQPRAANDNGGRSMTETIALVWIAARANGTTNGGRSSPRVASYSDRNATTPTVYLLSHPFARSCYA